MVTEASGAPAWNAWKWAWIRRTPGPDTHPPRHEFLQAPGDKHCFDVLFPVKSQLLEIVEHFSSIFLRVLPAEACADNALPSIYE